jgi:hypothetical protein
MREDPEAQACDQGQTGEPARGSEAEGEHVNQDEPDDDHLGGARRERGGAGRGPKGRV